MHASGAVIRDSRAQPEYTGGTNLPSEHSNRLCPTPDEDAAVAGCRRQSLTSSATPRDSCKENEFIPRVVPRAFQVRFGGSFRRAGEIPPSRKYRDRVLDLDDPRVFLPFPPAGIESRI
jgi:hypothetical protein